jgi:hypothetical protein
LDIRPVFSRDRHFGVSVSLFPALPAPRPETHQGIAGHASGASAEKRQAVKLRCRTQRGDILAIAVAGSAGAVAAPIAVAITAATWRSPNRRGRQKESQARESENNKSAFV